MKRAILLLIIFSTLSSYSQSNIDTILRGGEIIINGLSFLKGNKNESKTSNSKVVESVCIKNKLTDKITFILIGNDGDGIPFKKELVVQKDGKECVFELPKGIYSYEILLSNKEIFKKGEYKFFDEVIITVKPID